jgi:hypothetical protein
MGRTPDVVVNTHGHCFDGAASAAIFTALHRAIEGRDRTFFYRSCGYGPKMNKVPLEWLGGRENAILDFRYTESPALTWYFDHHKTAFTSEEEHREAERAVAGSKRRLFYDPDAGSCTKLIADVAASQFGLDLREHAELVRWAQTIDTAGFESAAAALADTPAQRIAAVIEHHGDTAYLETLVPLLLERSLEDVVKTQLVADREAPIVAARREFEGRIRERARVRGDVVFVDLSDEIVTAAGKFVTYALFPDTLYSVLVLRTKQLLKVSVGYNPWCGRERRHDIAELMKREGGGGHAVVGAAAFPISDLERARASAERVARALAE